MKIIFVLSNPICELKNYDIILSLFLKYYPKAFFIQTNKQLAEILNQKYSYYGTCCGLESHVCIKNWNLHGHKKNVIRTSVNQCKKQNIFIQEEYFRHELKEEVDKISKLS